MNVMHWKLVIICKVKYWHNYKKMLKYDLSATTAGSNFHNKINKKQCSTTCIRVTLLSSHFYQNKKHMPKLWPKQIFWDLVKTKQCHNQRSKSKTETSLHISVIAATNTYVQPLSVFHYSHDYKSVGYSLKHIFYWHNCERHQFS